MKTLIRIFLFSSIAVFASCKNNQQSIVGHYKIDGVGTTDTTKGKNEFTGFAILSMMSNGTEFDFSTDRKFTVSNNGKSYANGTYNLSSDGKDLTLNDGKEELKYEVQRTEQNISLKSVKDASVLNLKKE
jgi:hypothetical protein